MRSPARAVIVGAGLAGVRCAETLRAEGFAGQVTIVGDEPVGPYERPALSKELLASRRSPDELQVRPPSFYADHDIALVLGCPVVRIDLAERTAILADGRELAWDALVIATGARARRLPGQRLPPGVHHLRSLADALALREELLPGARLAVVGAGFVGAEVASTALELGVAVTLVDTIGPMERVLGAPVADVLARRFADHGADVRIGSAVAGFRAGPGGRVATTVLDSGEELACDAVLVAIGAEPTTGPLGWETAFGGAVAVDVCGRTAVEGVYACGDVAAVRREGGGVRRVEHWTSAAGQGAAVARAVLGAPAPYSDPPYFWSDQLGLRLQLVGEIDDASSVEIEGTTDSFTARYQAADGETQAVLAANRPHEIAAFRRELAVAPAAA